MKSVIELLKQIVQLLQDLVKPVKSHFFSVKVNNKGQIVGYLRPESAAVYCSMSISHFKGLLSKKEIEALKITEKITLIKIADIDAYIERKAKEN